LIAAPGEAVFRARFGSEVSLTPLPYGAVIQHHGVNISLHPAGHVLGSAQIRLEYRGAVTVVSGDYKRHSDPTCAAFEPIRCHTFLSESTFGMPIYRWPDPSEVVEEIQTWWRGNRDVGRASIIYAYALGKAQRILATLDPSIGPIVVHGAVDRLIRAYRASGVALPATMMVQQDLRRKSWAGALVLAPPSAQGTPWVRRFEPAYEAVASGWMTVRGIRRRRAIDRGFILSDHADWPGLIQTIRETQAEQVILTHGYTHLLARWLREQGIPAEVLETRFSGEVDDSSGEPA
jgi:putative mRNA 3-end processing factor